MLNKIEDIQKQFQGIPEFDPPHRDVPRFTRFSPLTTKQVRKVIIQMKSKSCELDTISTDKLKEIQDSCIDTITKIVTISLTNGEFCDQWKTAIVKPLLKELVLKLINRNYRPVSNLCFLSKLVEKCMLDQLLDHCNTNNLLPDFQLAYHQYYSIETSLINITNDILWGMENQEVTTMLLLDLSTAFNTVDHSILLKILNKSFGFCDQALKWFDRYQ